MKENLTLKTILWFFLPLMLMVEMIQLSHFITNAFLARLRDPTEALAAFSIAFALNSAASGIPVTSTQAGICFITDRTSSLRVLRFFCLPALATFLGIEVISLTPIGEIFFGDWFGASPGVVSQAMPASAIMGPLLFPILIRNCCYAVFMRNRRTIPITYGTGVRLAGLVFFLYLFSFWFEGAVVGALATVCGMSIEAVYLLIAVRPFFMQLGKKADRPASYGEIWRFSWPLMITQVSENGVMFVVNFFLGSLASPDLAIASFGVVFSLMRLILSPLRNLVQATQALVQKRKDFQAIVQFAVGLVLFYVGLNLIMFYQPVNALILDGLMGLKPELSAYSTPAVRLIFAVAVFWAASSLLRGVLAAMRKTGFIAVTAGVRLAVIAAIGSFSFFFADINGAVLGVLAFAGSFVAETLVLGWHFKVQVQNARSADSPAL